MTGPPWSCGLCCRWILIVVGVSGLAMLLSVCSCVVERYVARLLVVSAWVRFPLCVIQVRIVNDHQ